MRQQIAAKKQSSSSIEQGQSILGIIYLTWHSNTNLSRASHSAFIWAWKTFISQKVTDVFEQLEEYKGVTWTHDDMFVHFQFSGEKQEVANSRLLDMACLYKNEWESQFLLEHGDSYKQDYTLYAGVALSEIAGTLDMEKKKYETIKKAIQHGQTPHAVESSLRRKALERVLEHRLIDSVYQPIISLQNGQSIFGYEALSRSREKFWFPTPLELFTYAGKENLVYPLDRLAREKAIGSCTELRADQKLFINIMAEIMEDPEFLPGQTLSLLEKHQLSPHNVVFEITERSSIEDFSSVKKVLQHYRSQGYQIAIDDVGAGYSSLQSVVELRPDYIKIDRSLIQNIHFDEMKAHIVSTLAQLASKMDIQVIAEGIELAEELAKVQAMGIQFAQGYLTGRPSPMKAVEC